MLLRRRVRQPALAQRRLLEYLPLAALTLLFAFLALRAERLWAATRYSGPDPSALQVEAAGMQFAWYFRYPGPDAAFGRTLPTLIDPGAGNPLGLDPADPAAPTTSSPPSLSSPPTARSTSASTPRTSSTASPSPSSA